MARVLIITGMHRSGTSMITQWLNRCGLFIGDKLAGPDIGNVQGHFEDVDFLEMHEQLLKKRNCSTVGFVDKPILKLSSPDKQQLNKIIESKSSDHNEWGWKDPRTCLFLDTYNELIPSAFYLIIGRGYNATVSSMVTREHRVNVRRFQSKKGLSKLKWKLFKRRKIEKPFERYSEKFLRIWIHYYEKIFDHILSLPTDRYMFINYEALLEKDTDLFEYLKNNWIFSLDYFPFTSVYKKELISEVHSIEKYINDKELLEKAKKIEIQLKSYFVSLHLYQHKIS